MNHTNITIPIPISDDIRCWWFRKKIQFLRKCVEQVNKLYKKYCERKRSDFTGETEDISPDDTKELWNLLQTVRDLGYDISEDYRSIVSDGY